MSTSLRQRGAAVMSHDQHHYRIVGGRPLTGKVAVSGAKNAVTKQLVASLLSAEPSVLTNVPRTREIDIVLDVMSELGARIDWLDAHTVQVATPEVLDPSLNERYSGVNRIPILMMGPLLHRAGQASVPLPGGCRIGKRPIDFHLAGLRQMGAEVIQQPRSVARGRHGSGPPPRPQRRPRGRTAAQAHTLGEQGNASAPSAAGVAPHRPSGRPPFRRL